MDGWMDGWDGWDEYLMDSSGEDIILLVDKTDDTPA